MKEYLTLKEVAEKLAVSENCLYKWIYQKKFPVPFVKVNGNIRIRESALENYIKRQTINQQPVTN